MDCTPMIGQIGLGESGGVIHCSPVQPIVSQSHPVAGNQAPSEVSCGYRPH